MTPREVEAGQLAQIRFLLDHCARNVPYYRFLRRARRPLPSLDALRSIPVLTREAYQANQADMEALALPAGIFVSGGPSYTSGTTGVPVRTLHTNHGDLWHAAFCLRDWEWCGMDLRRPLAGIRLLAIREEDRAAAMSGIQQAGWTPFSSFLFLNGPAYGMDIRQDPEVQVEWLIQKRPSYLVSYPSNLEVLASILRDSGRHIPGLEVVQAIGETLTPEAEASISSGFRAPVRNLYSVTEGGYVASPCPDGHGLHVHAENFYAEVVDRDGNPCRPGETGRVLLTSLRSFATPFIRYDIQDYVTTSERPCPCGRGLPLWTRVEGRMHPMLRLPDGGLRISTSLILGVRKVGGVRQFQIVQRSTDDIVIKVVPSSEWNQGREADMISLVLRELGLPASVETVSSMPRLRGGKFNLVVVEPRGG